MVKEFLLEDIFNIYKGEQKYTKQYAIKNPGNYPVYSSQTINDGEIFKISTFDFDNNDYGECLTWTTDGIYAGTLFIRKNKFSLTTHAGALFVKDAYKNMVDIEYVYFVLKDILRKYAIGEDNKRLTKKIIEKIKICFPYTENCIDIKAQKIISERLKKVQNVKDKLYLIITRLQEMEVDPVPQGTKFKTIKASLLFDLSVSSNNSSFTKKVVNSNKGNIPVYGASRNSNEVGYGFIQDNVPGVKYFNDCLTINRNGSVGFVHKRTGKFTIPMDVTPLILKKEFKVLFDLDYLALAINKKLKTYNFDFANKAGKQRIANMEVEIPIDDNGDFSLEKQKEIYARYKAIQNIRNNIINSVHNIAYSSVIYK